MSLKLIDTSMDFSDAMRERIEATLPGARVEVRATSPGHYEVDVVSDSFAGKTRIAQHQLVYSAILDLMAGDTAPVHAIDRMTTRTS